MFIDNKIIFIHNPRAAGTATRRALKRGDEPNKNLPYPGHLPSMTSRNQKHAFASMVKMKISRKEWEDRFKFAIVRNPFERLVSLYGLFHKAHTGETMDLAKDDHKFDKFYAAFDHTDLNRFTKGRQRKFYRQAMKLNFKDWLALTYTHNWNNCRYLDGRKPMTQIQQIEWFTGLDRVFRFEELDELSEFLVERGYHPLKQENQSRHEPWQNYYDDETMAMVSEAFAEDIQRFGY